MSQYVVELSPETASRLREQADRQGTTVEKVLQGLAEQASIDAPLPQPAATVEERLAALRRLLSHAKPVNHEVDDSRESIYE